MRAVYEVLLRTGCRKQAESLTGPSARRVIEFRAERRTRPLFVSTPVCNLLLFILSSSLFISPTTDKSQHTLYTLFNHNLYYYSERNRTPPPFHLFTRDHHTSQPSQAHSTSLRRLADVNISRLSFLNLVIIGKEQTSFFKFLQGGPLYQPLLPTVTLDIRPNSAFSFHDDFPQHPPRYRCPYLHHEQKTADSYRNDYCICIGHGGTCAKERLPYSGRSPRSCRWNGPRRRLVPARLVDRQTSPAREKGENSHRI